MSNGKRVRLFGFSLTSTSALLLFITSAFLILASIVGLVQIISASQEADYFYTLYFFAYLIMLAFGLYVLFKTVKWRNKNE